MKKASDPVLTLVLTTLVAGFVVLFLHEFTIYFFPEIFAYEKAVGEVVRVGECEGKGSKAEEAYIFKVDSMPNGEATFLTKCGRFVVGDKEDLILSRNPVPAVIRLANEKFQFWILAGLLVGTVFVVSWAKLMERRRVTREARKEIIEETLEKYSKRYEKNVASAQNKKAPKPPPPPKK